jgi:predicted SprT family Zn-dependent metalloprotease
MSILLEKMNTKISNDLEVPKLKITYKISKKAKSKFGHCRYIEPGHYLINLSSFILNTELEKDTICHELCHAYDHHIFKSDPRNNDPAPHGIAWKMLMKEVFGYVNVKAQGIHVSNYNDVIKLINKGKGDYDLYINGSGKAKFNLINNMVNVRNYKNQFFKTEVEERKYMTIFIQQLNLINKL